MEQDSERHDEAGDRWQGAQAVDRECFRAVQLFAACQSGVLGRERMAAVAPAIALEHDQDSNDQQDQAGDLRRTGEAAAVVPGGEHGNRQCPDAEILAGADVVQRFQQHQRKPDRKRRARHRQRNMPEGTPAFGAEGACGLEDVDTLHLQHRPRREIDIRIQHAAEHEDGARRRTHVRQQAQRVTRRHPCGKQPVHEAERLEDVGIDIGVDIGGDRQRQRQQPDQMAASGEVMGRHQPGGAGAGGERDHPDTGQQQGRVPQRLRQHVTE